MMYLCCPYAGHMWHISYYTSTAWYSLFVLKVPLNTKQITNQLSLLHVICQYGRLRSVSGDCQACIVRFCLQRSGSKVCPILTLLVILLYMVLSVTGETLSHHTTSGLFVNHNFYFCCHQHFFVYLLARLQKSCSACYCIVQWKGGMWAMEEIVRFWW